jgi:hypothetical protein
MARWLLTALLFLASSKGWKSHDDPKLYTFMARAVSFVRSAVWFVSAKTLLCWVFLAEEQRFLMREIQTDALSTFQLRNALVIAGTKCRLLGKALVLERNSYVGYP